MTTITAEESRALLERRARVSLPFSTDDHLRAALDREGAALVQIGELAEQVGLAQNDVIQARAERDAARAEKQGLALDALSALRQANDAYEAQFKAEAERDAARAEVERLRGALAVYADPVNWKMNGPLDANGARFTGGPARAALASESRA